MKIAINTSAAIAGGAVTHLRHLLPHLVGQMGEDELVVIGDAATRQQIQPPTNVEWLEIAPIKGGFVERLWRETFEIPRLVKAWGADAVFHPANFALFRCPVPQVILIHNLAPYLEDVIADESPRQRLRLSVLRWLTQFSLKWAEKSVFISPWGRRRVLGSKRLDEVRYPVIPFGAEHGAAALGKDALEKFDLEKDGFVLTVSHIYRYKKLEKLVEAWVDLGDEVADIPLLIVGRPFDEGHASMLRDRAACSKSRVIFTGDLNAEMLGVLMKHARVFVFTSQAENLPITLLEAMAAGCPIVTNRFCSMPETCGDAALYAEPATPANYRAAISTLLWNYPERQALSEKARRRALDFTWADAARKSLAAIRSA
jgi:glycosyltransferase involved in cell wall biosynthesis